MYFSAPDAADDQIANAELPADLPHAETTPFVGEGSCGRDHGNVPHARQIDGEIAGHRIGKSNPGCPRRSMFRNGKTRMEGLANGWLPFLHSLGGGRSGGAAGVPSFPTSAMKRTPLRGIVRMIVCAAPLSARALRAALMRVVTAELDTILPPQIPGNQVVPADHPLAVSAAR